MAKKLDRVPMPDLLRVDEELGQELRQTAEADERPIIYQIRFLLHLGLKARRLLFCKDINGKFWQARSINVRSAQGQ